MGLTMSEKIKVVLKRRGMTMGELAEKTGQTRQNLSNKMTRDNFPEKELRQIAEALDCELESYLVMKDTGERV
ncbi:MAG: helix-turn-helix domain-containing protein [Clostridia bacterium]|nr:helix-turn-helix domain-containing protein [Clostridia bacterium]